MASVTENGNALPFEVTSANGTGSPLALRTRHFRRCDGLARLSGSPYTWSLCCPEQRAIRRDRAI